MTDRDVSPQSSSTELATDRDTSTVAADLKSLREDLGALRSDLGSDIATLTQDMGRLARDTTTLLREASGTVADRGRKTVEMVHHRVEERPVTISLLTLGVGLAAGLLLGLSSRSSQSADNARYSSRRFEVRGASRQATGTSDEHYDLYSSLYHLTKGAWEYEQYAHDAERNNDRELAQLFRKVQSQHRNLAARVKQVLKDRLS